jgi:hypothetical protein
MTCTDALAARHEPLIFGLHHIGAAGGKSDGSEWDGFAETVMVILWGFPVGALPAAVAILNGLCRCHGPFWVRARLSCLVNGGFLVYFNGLILDRGAPLLLHLPLLSLLATVLAMVFFACYAASRGATSGDTGNGPPAPE